MILPINRPQYDSICHHQRDHRIRKPVKVYGEVNDYFLVGYLIENNNKQHTNAQTHKQTNTKEGEREREKNQTKCQKIDVVSRFVYE